ncbi:DNA-directed RNA polymerase subunit beta [Streptococcus sp. DD12]|uniref:DNA-directed RNA polymerase subunit beta n=1 Tax=Streptococcus sp. DD12 TaxID=1777880 RepID=UPI0007919364|nr:DNA-directed RNA polymerase subunit beta [Streptococcus sp. DD12]KXT77023.1 Competence-associated EpuA protein [Streptococcus sp. DD12]
MTDYGWTYVLKQVRLLLLIALVCLALLALGLMIGYSFIGGGGNPLEVLNPSTWQDIIAKFSGK